MEDIPVYVYEYGDDGFYYIILYDIPILHFTDEKLCATVTHLLNQECKKRVKLMKKIESLEARDESRLVHQRVLEAKIHRLKERIKVLEK